MHKPIIIINGCRIDGQIDLNQTVIVLLRKFTKIYNINMGLKVGLKVKFILIPMK